MEQSVTEQQMRDLPLNGRNPLQLTTLTAGSGAHHHRARRAGRRITPASRSTACDATENTYTLDGTIYVNRFFDSVPTMPNPDALQEFTIQASNYSADHGALAPWCNSLRAPEPISCTAPRGSTSATQC